MRFIIPLTPIPGSYHRPGPLPWTQSSPWLKLFRSTRSRTSALLKNIFKELKNDLGCPIPQSGSLEKWAEQGVLLLNSVLTVKSSPNSHRGKGWEIFTDQVIKTLNEQETP